MAVPSAEEHFRRGRGALAQRRPAAAARHFLAAMAREREIGVLRPQMRFLSYYGLSLAAGHKPTRQAIACCEQAASTDEHDVELQLNLARAYYLAGLPTRALAVVERGLRRDPGHRGLARLLGRIDRRSPPFLPALGRDHPLNRSIGRLRARLSRPRAAAAGSESTIA
jgi:predicted Zn-dependent protease